jgi:hypothetical protein
MWLGIYLLFGLLLKRNPDLFERLFGAAHKDATVAPMAGMSTPVVAMPAQPLYEEKTVTLPSNSKAFSKALVPYIKDGWKVEKITALDRKNRLVHLQRKK